METTEQFWRTKARIFENILHYFGIFENIIILHYLGIFEDNHFHMKVRGENIPRGNHRLLGMGDDRLNRKKMQSTTSTDIFGNKVEGRRGRETSSRSRGRWSTREESSSSCTPSSGKGRNMREEQKSISTSTTKSACKTTLGDKSVCKMSKTKEEEKELQRVQRRRESGDRKGLESQRKGVCPSDRVAQPKEDGDAGSESVWDRESKSTEEDVNAQALSLLLSMDSILSLEGKTFSWIVICATV